MTEMLQAPRLWARERAVIGIDVRLKAAVLFAAWLLGGTAHAASRVGQPPARPLTGAPVGRADARAQAASAPATRPAAAKLRYEITYYRPEVTVDGGLSKHPGFKFRLVNGRPQPVTVFWPREPYVDVYCFTVTRKDGTAMPALRGPSAPVALTTDFKEIPPGGEVSYNVVWSIPRSAANCQEFAFTEPGEYVVQPSFVCTVDTAEDPNTGKRKQVPGAWTGRLEAEPFTLKVKPRPPREHAPTPGGPSILGRVTGPEGKPITGARVDVLKRVSSMGDMLGYALSGVDHQSSDVDGGFAFEGLPDDSALLVVKVTHPRYRPAERKIVLAPPRQRYACRIELAPGAIARGVFVDTRGEPLAGVRVTDGADRMKTTYTDAKGRFGLFGLSGDAEVYLHAWKEHFQGRYYRASREEAASGDWVITLYRKSKLACSGRAVFADGTPASKMRLSFHGLVNERGEKGYANGRTDEQGRFSVTLSGAGTFKGTAWAEALPRDHDKPDRWRAPVEGLAVGQHDLKIVFDNRRVIAVRVEPANPLPSSTRFKLRCRMAGPPDDRWEPVGSGVLEAGGGRYAFAGRSPGRYQVEVRVSDAESWSWSREVVVPDDAEGLEAIVRFPLPELGFGGLRMLLVAENGEPLVSSASVWLHSSGRSGKVPVRDGLIELSEVPVGMASLFVRPAGYLERSVAAEIRAGETTDLGRVVLERSAPESGRVEGRLLYDDDTVVLGAKVRGLAIGSDGRFRVEVPAGEQTFTIDLTGVVGWPRVPSGQEQDTAGSSWTELGVHPRWRDQFLAAVDMDAGQTVTRDVVLNRSDLSDLRVVCRGAKPANLWVLLVVSTEGGRLVRTGGSSLKEEGGAWTFTIPDVPPGDRLVLLAAKDYYGYQELKRDAATASVTFDLPAAGTLKGIAVRKDESRAPRVSVEVVPEPFARLGPVPGIDNASLPIAINYLKRLRTGKDGAFHARLCPGRYIVRTPQAGPSNAQVVPIKSAGETHVTLTTAAVSHGPSPLRLATDPAVESAPAGP